MDNYRVNVTQSAFEDLKSIALYIKDNLKEPITAEKQVLRIKEAILSLDQLPYRHSLVRDKLLASQGYRSIFVDNYTIFYIIAENEKTVSISRIQYSRTNWVDIL